MQQGVKVLILTGKYQGTIGEVLQVAETDGVLDSVQVQTEAGVFWYNAESVTDNFEQPAPGFLVGDKVQVIAQCDYGNAVGYVLAVNGNGVTVEINASEEATFNATDLTLLDREAA